MIKKFSTHWKASKQPRKQRKYRAQAPLHIKRKFLSVHLSKELRKKYGRRNVVVRKNDVVKIMKGKFKKKKGKVLQVFTNTQKVIIEGIQVKKQDGSKVAVKMRPSILQIIELNTDDAKRLESGKTEKKTESKESSLKDSQTKENKTPNKMENKK